MDPRPKNSYDREEEGGEPDGAEGIGGRPSSERLEDCDYNDVREDDD